MRFSTSGFLALICLAPNLTIADGFGAIAQFSSNYVYRGYSKSDNNPIYRVNADYSHPIGLFGGLWLSRVDFGDKQSRNRSNLEIYPYLGYHYAITQDWHLEATFSRYFFSGWIAGKPSDYNEYGASIHYRDWISARVDFADNTYNRGGSATNLEITGRYPLTSFLRASAGIGYNNATPALEYTTLYWNLGVTLFYRHAALDVRYVDVYDLATSHNPNSLVLPDLNQNFMVSLSLGF